MYLVCTAHVHVHACNVLIVHGPTAWESASLNTATVFIPISLHDFITWNNQFAHETLEQ